MAPASHAVHCWLHVMKSSSVGLPLFTALFSASVLGHLHKSHHLTLK